jgi:phosphatidylserine/phosphatidylglycerophosphate/cardiolipin synthase-like enzyme
MAKFLNKEKAVSELKDLIRNADQTLILISPYLKLSYDFKELLTFRNSKERITSVIFGKQELNPDEMKFLQGLRFVILKYNENLHAKCYVNDDKMIITSLNLYEFSMANNKEMGVLIDKNDPADITLYKESFDEVDFIAKTSQPFPFEFAASKPKAHKTDFDNSKAATQKSSDKPTGYCIRTGVEIPFNVEKPMSYDAYKSWSKYNDKDYPEKYCHFSGESSDGKTSVSKPILAKNWKRAKELFHLA